MPRAGCRPLRNPRLGASPQNPKSSVPSSSSPPRPCDFRPWRAEVGATDDEKEMARVVYAACANDELSVAEKNAWLEESDRKIPELFCARMR